MGYLKDFRAELSQLIEDGEVKRAVDFAANAVLESYKNGQREQGSKDEEPYRQQYKNKTPASNRRSYKQ